MTEVFGIPVSPAAPISRSELARLWGLGDRATRARIARLRTLPGPGGAVLVSSSGGAGGYRWSCNDVEIRHFVQEIERRARHVRAPLREARKALKQLETTSSTDEGQQLDFLKMGGVTDV